MVEDMMTGCKLHTCSAYLTFVALDAQGKPTAIAPVIPETEEQQRRYREAGERREYRLAMRNRNTG
jgi:acyl-CoA hydrolase